MKKIYAFLKLPFRFHSCFILFGILTLSFNDLKAQCPVCSVPSFTVNLTAKVDTSYALVGQTRSGTCCSDNNCIRFVVFLNPNADLLNFNVTSPSPSGSAYYSINCGSLTSIGTPVCIYGQSSVCITYCKPGGDSPTYNIIQSKAVKASPDNTVRVGCFATMTVGGLTPSSAVWTSIFPGTPGQYNSLLSCTSGCTLTTVTPTAASPAYIDYMVSGTPVTLCGGATKDTVRIFVVPTITANITPTNAAICSGSTGSVVLTASVSGGAPPFTYTWSTGATGSSVNVASGNYTVTIKDMAASCPAITRTVSVLPINTPSAPVLGNNGPLCSGQNLNLTSTNSGGSSWSWTGPNGFTSSVQNPTIAAATVAAGGTYSATMTFSGCTGPPGITTVTIHPIPNQPLLSSNSPVCAGSVLSFSAAPIAGANYFWTGPNGFSSNTQNPSISAATTSASGVYSVYITVNGCASSTATLNLTVNPVPAVPTVSNNSAICSGQTLNLFSGPAGSIYNWTGPNGFTSSVQNPTITGASTLASGSYSVTQTVLGCTSPAGLTTVTVNPIPAAPTVSNNSAICEGQTLNLFSNPSGSIYSWTGPNGFSSTLQNPTIAGASTLASGSYSVTQTLLGCTSPLSTTDVTVNPIPAAPTVSNNSTICSGQTLNLFSSPAGSVYSWTGPNGFSSTVQNPTIVSASTLASGTYSVSQTLLGCTSPLSTTDVTVNPIPAAPTVSNNSAICEGQTLNLFSNPSGSIYSWTGPNGFSSTLQNPTIAGASTLASGSYSVTQTLLGCTSPLSTTDVTVNPIPAAPTVSNNSAICEGQTLNLFSNPAGSAYNWSGPNGFVSALQNPSIAGASLTANGTYSVTQTVLGCTSAEATTEVTVSPIPAAPLAGSNSSLCAGQTLSLTASQISGATYNWSGPNGFASATQNPVISPAGTSGSGTYSVNVTVNGCNGPISTVSVLINPVPPPPLASNNSSLCTGQTLSLSASSGADSYAWSGPNGFTSLFQNPFITNVSLTEAGTYSVTQSIAGCVSAEAITNVTIIPTPNSPVGTSNSPVCGGQNLIFSINPAGGIYSWTGPNSFTSTVQNPTISPATPASTGDYSVTITLQGCTSLPGIISASVGSTPDAPDANSNSPLCIGSTLNLTASYTNNVTYTWTGPNGFSSSLQNPSIAGTTTLASGVYTVGGDINGCYGPLTTVTVVVDEPAFVDAGIARDTICASAGQIPVNGILIGTNVSGVWTSSGAGSFNSPTSLNTFYNISPADTIAGEVKLILSSQGGGCPAQHDTITYVILGSPVVNAGPDVNVCKNSFVALNATITGVTTTGIWSSTGSGFFNPNTGSLNGNYIPGASDTAAGSITLILESTNNKGCAARRDSILVNFMQSPKADFINSAGCAGQPLAFTDNSAPTASLASYLWDFGDASGSSAAANPNYTYTTTTTYTVMHIAILANGCKDTVRKTVNVNRTPLADFTFQSPCVGTQANFFDASTAAPDDLVSWNWNFGNGLNSTEINPVNTFTGSGQYSVNCTVTSSKGCSNTAVKTVTAYPRPIADFGMSSTQVLAYDNVSFKDLSQSSSPLTIWNWQFQNGVSPLQNPDMVFTDKGIHTVTLTIIDQYGCRDSVTKDVAVTLLPMVPNAFTPNNDGSNDVLYVKGGPFVKMSFRVYNNWGEMVFDTGDQEKGWDGKYKGQQSPLGVYVWILDVEMFDGKSIRKTGDVTILK